MSCTGRTLLSREPPTPSPHHPRLGNIHSVKRALAEGPLRPLREQLLVPATRAHAVPARLGAHPVAAAEAHDELFESLVVVIVGRRGACPAPALTRISCLSPVVPASTVHAAAALGRLLEGDIVLASRPARSLLSFQSALRQAQPSVGRSNCRQHASSQRAPDSSPASLPFCQHRHDSDGDSDLVLGNSRMHHRADPVSVAL